jgi:hypothetical protein
MLDLNHPMTEHIFAASRHDDAILSIAKRMTLVPTEERDALLCRSREHFASLRKLNQEHFEHSDFIASAIDELESGCEKIASLVSTEDHTDGCGSCPVCSTVITNLKDYQDMTYCGKCLGLISAQRAALDSLKGFGLFAI